MKICRTYETLRHSLGSREGSHWVLCRPTAQLFCFCYLSDTSKPGNAAIAAFKHPEATTKSYQLLSELQQKFNSLDLFQESFSSYKTPIDCKENSNIHLSLPLEQGPFTPPRPT